ncbi:helix-turn-helix domain-containing protein [Halonotius pteroides]|uniref:Helix-turn-helix domain-containing protein n=1 Tax=Halonotius pteroides TaxID=268735 RepID=A0A3A6PZ57_9EURY|nr:helix-turn-helix domain-containing protein [Halonotius pteroides]RJX47870.1 helix-turn-helix domain-containing protein [Halonotius pteroides]
MGVIVELALPATEFQLGRILAMQEDVKVTLKTMVPLGGRSVPFFQISAGSHEGFEQQVRDHPTVSDLYVVNSHDDETLYGLDWEIDDDTFFDSVIEQNGHLLEASGGSDTWVFQVRFRSHDDLSTFQQSCFDGDIPVDVRKIYNPTRPDAGPWYGLTTPQRETLTYAVEMGYYSLPRGISTEETADEFGISDQAVSERLRRAVETLVTNTLLLTAAEE